MHTVNFLQHFIIGHEFLAYAIIFFGILLEGEFFVISSGILLFIGVLNIYIISVIIFCNVVLYFVLIIGNSLSGIIFLSPSLLN